MWREGEEAQRVRSVAGSLDAPLNQTVDARQQHRAAREARALLCSDPAANNQGPRTPVTEGDVDEQNGQSEGPEVVCDVIVCHAPDGGMLPNGSRLSCGRLARQRKSAGRSPGPARGTTLR